MIRAVRAGDIARVQTLAASGVPIDATNARGQTALHVAATLGRAEIAALLLAHGADHRLLDVRGRTPLDPGVNDIEVLHSIRQHYQRIPDPGFEIASNSASNSATTVCSAIAELRASGIAKIPDLIDAQLLTQLRTHFATFTDELQRSIDTGDAHFEHYDQEMYYWPTELAYITNNAFKHSAALARLCCSDPIVEIVDMYLEKQAFIQRAVAMRYLPADISGRGTFRYHHDLVDRRLKVMVLLTDVGEDDQYMSYVRGHPSSAAISLPRSSRGLPSTSHTRCA